LGAGVATTENAAHNADRALRRKRPREVSELDAFGVEAVAQNKKVTEDDGRQKVEPKEALLGQDGVGIVSDSCDSFNSYGVV